MANLLEGQINGAAGKVIAPVEHIFEALGALMHRVVHDPQSVGIEMANPFPKAVFIEQYQILRGNKTVNKFRMVVAKQVLDMLHDGEMDIVGLLKAVSHRYSKPGVVLVNAPCRASNNTYLPHLSDCFTIDYHSHSCKCVPADMDPTVVLREMEAHHKDIRRRAQPGSKDHRFPWAADEAIQSCDCFRSKRLKYTRGISRPVEETSMLSQQLGGEDRAAAMGLGKCTEEDVGEPLEEIAFDAHLSRLYGKRRCDMTDEERESIPLDKMHPSSTSWYMHGAKHGYPFQQQRYYIAKEIINAGASHKRKRTAQAPVVGGDFTGRMSAFAPSSAFGN